MKTGIRRRFLQRIRHLWHRKVHGLVGLRPIPADKAGTHHNHGGSWEGLPTFDTQKGNYPFVAKQVDILFGWVPHGDFTTKQVFFEYYWGLSAKRDSLDPNKNELIRIIRTWEERGGDVVHILICREARLAVNRGWPDAKIGPFKEDGRILSAGDIHSIRQLFKEAYAQKLTNHDNYRLIMLVEDPLFFASNPAAQHVIRLTEGVAYEAHQFRKRMAQNLLASWTAQTSLKDALLLKYVSSSHWTGSSCRARGRSSLNLGLYKMVD